MLVLAVLLLFPGPRDLPPFAVGEVIQFLNQEIDFHVVKTEKRDGQWKITLRGPSGILYELDAAEFTVPWQRKPFSPANGD